MKRILFFMIISCLALTGFGQTNMAVPGYASQSNTYNAYTGNIKFYLNGVSQTLTVGRGANAVAFYGNNMFVAIDDAIGSKGIIWYANVSFSTGTFSSDAPVVLVNNQGTFSVAVDTDGNVYSANYNGTVTKFIRGIAVPFYSSSNIITQSFWSGGQFAEASGVMVDNATNTLWVVSYANNQIATCPLNNLSNIKKINTNGNFIQKPEGIVKDNLGNIWIGNNNNNYTLRINNAAVSTIIAELSAANYTLKTLVEGIDINDFLVSPNLHQLGGIIYDNLYSKKLYINDQIANGNSFVYSFTPTNATPSFVATSMSQIYPGAGQCAIIPCALLPTPANPIASGTTISSGQTAILTASSCNADQTYLWKQGATQVGTSASYTTPALTSSTTYTVYCVRGETCQSSGTNVVVTVNGGSCPPPTLSATANTPARILNSAVHTNLLTANGCAGTITWSTGSTNTAISVPAAASPSSTYSATCTIGNCVSPAASITLNYIAPSTITATPLSLCARQTATFTSQGCVGTVVWYRFNSGTGSYTNIGTGTPFYHSPQQGNMFNPTSYVATCIVGGQSSTTSNGVSFTVTQTPAVTSASANPIVINLGETSVLTASGCSNGYRWYENGYGISTNASFTSHALTATTTYTVHCLNANGVCLSAGTDVVVVVSNPCEFSATVDGLATPGPFSPNQIIQASSEIYVGNGINRLKIDTSNSNNLTLRAGKFIIISNDITVENGAVFKAEIGGCIGTTMQVKERFLYDVNNQKTILIGANLPLLDDWNFPASDKLAELEKTGANAVRIQWYINYGQASRPGYSLTDLDNFLTKCKNNKMIPILDIHDFTCGADISVLNSQAIPWWTSLPVLSVLNKHKKYLIINLANELGNYRWAGDNAQQATALTNFKDAYKMAITSIRNAGLDVPIMIDAPDCGTTLGAFNSIGAELITHDPRHNLLLSAHAYWAGYDGTSEIATTIANNLPIVFGEVANKQSEGNDLCYYDLDGTSANHPPVIPFTYQSLLTTCQSNQISWLAWSWFPDGCSSRNMSSTGNYINLTTFGNDVVNNATYGIKNKAARSNGF